MIRGQALAAALALAACTSRGEVLRPAGPVVLHASDVRLSTSWAHACAVAGGALACWGDDADGRLGVAPSGTATGQGPIAIPGGPWTAPGAGTRHSCALAADGIVSCWGANDLGQLGTGDLTSSNDPRPVALPAQALDLRTAFDHSCALLADASLWCWGDNLEGALGLGDQYPGAAEPSPVEVGDGHDWTFVSTGQGHTCGIRAPGTLYCWGRNTDGELGQGGTQPAEIRTPTEVGTDADWVEVSCGQATTCGRKRDGSLYCFGTMASGALAVGDVDPHPLPARVPSFADWTSVSTSAFHTCGLRAGGLIFCAGRNTEGQLGTPDLADARPDMQLADPNAGWIEARAGRFFTCARKADGSVWCLGTNAEHELAADPSVSRSDVMLRVM
jgi:alpha-tubulin suppressor-like RCC1 family protein